MASESGRQSDRVSVELAIQVSGTDALGAAFLVEARTVVVSRSGAKIVLARKLAPEQELTIRCVASGQEAVGRVVGQIGEAPEGYFYGILLLDSEENPWGINFPPLADSEKAVGRVLLECVRCHNREVAYLDEFELEVFEANQSLSRKCQRCADTTLWKKSFGEVPTPAPEPSPPRPAPARPQIKRREPRRRLRVTACVRSQEFGEELVTTQDVSRSGLCFESRKQYGKGWEVEVAVPYSPGGGNIFLRAQIASVQEVPSGEVARYGVSYIRSQKD